MKFIQRKRFKKMFRNLSQAQRDRVNEALRIFVKNPMDPILRNHPLKGGLKGKRAIDIEFDLRISFEEYDEYHVVVLLAVGTHQQVYGKS